MKLGEIVTAYREEHGLSMRQFAKLSGLSHAYIPLIERGTNHNGEPLVPSITVYKQLAAAMGMTLHELMQKVDGDEQVDISAEANPTAPASDDPLNLPNIHPVTKKKFPVLGKVACGEPIYADEDRETFISSSADINADFCLIAQGDSMKGAHIDDGDVVFIRETPIVPNGKIAVVLIEDEATLKYIDYRPEQNTLILNPANPAFRPQIYTGEELNHIRVLGQAVVVQKYLTHLG